MPGIRIMPAPFSSDYFRKIERRYTFESTLPIIASLGAGVPTVKPPALYLNPLVGAGNFLDVGEDFTGAATLLDPFLAVANSGALNGYAYPIRYRFAFLLDRATIPGATGYAAVKLMGATGVLEPAVFIRAQLAPLTINYRYYLDVYDGLGGLASVLLSTSIIPLLGNWVFIDIQYNGPAFPNAIAIVKIGGVLVKTVTAADLGAISAPDFEVVFTNYGFGAIAQNGINVLSQTCMAVACVHMSADRY